VSGTNVVDALPSANKELHRFSGKDGSRQFTAKVDATGTGANLVAATVTKNGELVRTTPHLLDTNADLTII
jgi:hypothetical protein